MASTISYNVNANTTLANAALTGLYNRGVKLFSQGLNVNINGKALSSFDRSLDQATARILSFTATTLLISKTTQALKNLTTQAIDVETAITGIQSILNATNADLGKFTKGLFTIANQTGTSFYDAAEAANEFSRAGLSLEKTLQATAAALGIVRTSGGNVKDTVQGLISIVNSFDSENLGFGEVADKLSALDAAFSTSASGLVQAFGRVGVAASDAGVSIDELGGLVSAIKQISGRGEAQIGNSLKSIFTSIQNEKVQGVIEGIGVATKDANGEFRTATDVLRDLSEAYKTLTDSEKAFVSQKIASKTQANAFASTIQAFQTGGAARGTAISAGSDDNINKRLAILNETTATAIQRIQNSVTELSSTLGDAVGRNFVEGLVKYGNAGLDQIKTLFEKGNPIGNSLTSGLSAALTGPGVVLGVTLLIALTKKVFLETINAGRALLANVLATQKQNEALKVQLALEQSIVQAAAKKAAYNTRVAALPPRPAALPANPTPLQSQQFAAQNQKRADAVNQLRREASLQRRSERYDRMFPPTAAQRGRNTLNSRGGAIGAAFLVPAAFSAVSSGFDEGSTKRQLDATGQGLSTALIGASFGKLGGIVGGLIGGFQILQQVTKELYGNLDDVNAQTRESVNQNEKIKQSGDLFVQALQKYREALSTGNTALIDRAQKEFFNAQKNLDPSRKSLVGITDPNRLIEKNDALNAASDLKIADVTLPSAAQGIVTEAYKGFVDQLSGVFEKKVASNTDSEKLASQIIDSLDFSKISEASVNKLRQDFGATGDAGPVRSFIQGLTASLPGATEAITKFSQNFQGGAESLSVALTNLIGSTLERTKLEKLRADSEKKIINGDKIFRDAIKNSFADRELKTEEGARERQRLLGRFQSSTSNLTGRAAEDAATRGSLLDNKNTFINSIESAKSSFLPELEKALLSNVEGEAARTNLLGSIEKVLGESFDPAQIKEILRSSLSPETTASIFLKLNDSLLTYGRTVQNSSAIYEENIKTIREEAKERARLTLKFLGNPREDQSSALSAIRAGDKAFRDSKTPKRDRNGNIIVDTKDPNNLSAAKTRASREDLNRLEIQGKTGIRTQSDAETKGRVRKDLSQLVNAQRVETDQGLISDLLDNFKSKDKANNFGFGGTNGFEKLKKDLLAQIADNNFTSVPGDNSKRASQSLDRNPFIASLKQNSELPGASELIKGIQSAQQRSEQQNSLVENLSTQFLTETDLLGEISGYAKSIDSKISSMVPNPKTGVETIPSAKAADIFSKNTAANDITKNLITENQKLSALKENLVSTPANVMSQFQGNLLKYTQRNSIIGLNSAQSTFRAGGGDGDYRNPAYAGQNLSADETAKLGEIMADAIVKKLDKFQINQSIQDAFPEKSISGQSRGTEIIRGGVADPFMGKEYENFLKERRGQEQEVKERQEKIRVLENKKSETDPQKTEDMTKAIGDLKTISENLIKGITQTIDANVDVNVAGVNSDTQGGLIAYMDKRIKELFVTYYKETTGKTPVLAPTALA